MKQTFIEASVTSTHDVQHSEDPLWKHIERNPENWLWIVIIENEQNQVLEMFISIKFDVESNEITPAIVLKRWHEEYEMSTENNIKKVYRATQIVELEKQQGQIWN